MGETSQMQPFRGKNYLPMTRENNRDQILVCSWRLMRRGTFLLAIAAADARSARCRYQLRAHDPAKRQSRTDLVNAIADLLTNN